MPRFRKKPVEVTAVQWTGHNFAEVAELIQFDVGVDRALSMTNVPRAAVLYVTDDEPLALVMTTIHGETAVARVGDWVIPEPTPARAYPCNAAVFAETYDRLD